MLLETMTMPEKVLDKTKLVNVIILLYKNPNFEGFSKSFDIEICGKPMRSYVELAVNNYPTKTTVCTLGTNIFSLIPPHIVCHIAIGLDFHIYSYEFRNSRHHCE